MCIHILIVELYWAPPLPVTEFPLYSPSPAWLCWMDVNATQLWPTLALATGELWVISWGGKGR